MSQTEGTWCLPRVLANVALDEEKGFAKGQPSANGATGPLLPDRVSRPSAQSWEKGSHLLSPRAKSQARQRPCPPVLLRLQGRVGEAWGWGVGAAGSGALGWYEVAPGSHRGGDMGMTGQDSLAGEVGFSKKGMEM